MDLRTNKFNFIKLAALICLQSALINKIKMKRAFTLIELMVVISVIAILATIALVGLNRAQASARDVGRQATITGLQTALERYMGDTGSYWTTAPNNFCGLVAGMVAGGYLSAAVTDPKGRVVVCGTGNQITGGATYSYLGADTAYTFVLGREGGGLQTFNSPR